MKLGNLLLAGTAAAISYWAVSNKDKIAQEDIKTAILTVPSVKAQEVADLLVDAGIEGILCFSPVNLNLPRHVVVQYVDLTSELQTLLYFMKEEEKSRRNND